jgi:hypothetical protein
MKKKQKLELASDPSTSAEDLQRLGRLSSRKNREIVLSVLRNPNASGDTLLEVAAVSVYDFVENPVTPLLLIEDALLLDRASAATLIALAVYPDLPEWLAVSFSMIALDKKVSLLRQRGLNPHVLHALAQDSSADLQCLITMHPNVMPETLEVLAHTPHPKVRLGIAKNIKTAAHVLHRLASEEPGPPLLDAPSQLILLGVDATSKQRPATDLLCAIAKHLNTPREALRLLLEDPSDEVRATAIQNPAAASLVDKKHATDSAWEVRRMAARFLSDEEALQKLSNDPRARVRLEVAKNRATSAEILARLSTDEDIYVCEAVAQHPNTTEESLFSIAKSPSSHYASFALAESPRTPLSVLRRLLRDESVFVRDAARKNLTTREEH